MKLLKSYLEEIEHRKNLELSPKPIENCELIKELIQQIKDLNGKYRKLSLEETTLRQDHQQCHLRSCWSRCRTYPSQEQQELCHLLLRQYKQASVTMDIVCLHPCVTICACLYRSYMHIVCYM